MINNKKNETARSSYVIFFPMLFLVLILEIVRLPAVIAAYRPDFMGLLLIFFAIADPLRINVGIAWISGILLDLLTGAPLSINGLAIAAQVYVVVSYFRHFALFAIWQQMSIIGILHLLIYGVMVWFENLIGQSGSISTYVYQTGATILFWPVMLVLCQVCWNIFNIQAASIKKENDL